MVNSRNLISGMIAGRKPERMGLFEEIWADTLDRWVREEGYPVTQERYENTYFTADHERDFPADPVYQFAFDVAIAGGWFDITPIRGHREVLEETSDWILTRNGAGAAFKRWKHKSGTPEHVDFAMSSRDVWERDYKPHLLSLDPGRLDIPRTKSWLSRHRANGKWTFYGSLFVWETMRQCLGDVYMYETLALDHDWIRDFNRTYTDFYMKHYALLFDQAGVPDSVWLYDDLAYNKGLFCSFRTLMELYFPYYKEMVDFLHSRGTSVIFHSCGRMADALPLIVDAGFDGLNPMEVKAGSDVLDYAERFGERLVFFGGYDTRFAESGDKALMKREVKRLLDGMRARGGRYVFASDHSISTNVRLADYQYLLDCYREEMWC